MKGKVCMHYARSLLLKIRIPTYRIYSYLSRREHLSRYRRAKKVIRQWRRQEQHFTYTKLYGICTVLTVHRNLGLAAPLSDQLGIRSCELCVCIYTYQIGRYICTNSSPPRPHALHAPHACTQLIETKQTEIKQ